MVKASRLAGWILAGIGLAATSVQAKPEFLDTLLSTYKPYAAALETRSCANCHASDSDFTQMNPYGKDVKAALKASGGMVVTPAVLKQVENLDSVHNGSTNLAKIQAGLAPGDPKSIPPKSAAPTPASTPPAPAAAGGKAAPAPAQTGVKPAPAPTPASNASSHAKPGAPTAPAPASSSHPAAPAATGTAPAPATSPAPAPTNTAPAAATETTASAPSTPAPAPEEETSWIPKNGFHPAIVHFPIALFLAGIALDLAGYIKKSKTLLYAGWYNLVLAAISAVCAILTGILALMYSHAPIGGGNGLSLIGQHMLLAIVAAFLMWIMVSLRVHRHEEMGTGSRTLYFLLAAACILLISYAGHLGGKFVYGS